MKWQKPLSPSFYTKSIQFCREKQQFSCWTLFTGTIRRSEAPNYWGHLIIYSLSDFITGQLFALAWLTARRYFAGAVLRDETELDVARTDGACGFVTWGVYVPGLGLGESVPASLCVFTVLQLLHC